jgi:amicyanin
MKNKGLLAGVAIIIVIVAVVLIAVGGKKSTPAYTSSPSSTQSSTKSDNAALSNAVATNTATLANYAFSPAVIKVKVGDTVTWTNKDSVHHTVTASTSSSDAPNSPLFGQGETYKFTFTTAGTYTLHCTPHPYMHQIVEVTN